MQKAAVLIAAGIDVEGKRTVLAVSVAMSEHEVHWRTFLQSLVSRGLCGVRLVTSDAHEGLKAARFTVFGGVPSSGASSTCSRTLRRMSPGRT